MLETPLFAIIFWVLLIPSLWISGSLAGFWVHEKNPILKGIMTMACGLGFYAYYLVFFGSFGLLKPVIVILFIAASLMLGWRQLPNLMGGIKDLSRFMGTIWKASNRFLQIFSFAAILLTALLCFLPEIANDSVALQLYVSKLFAKHASISPQIYDLVSFRPLLINVLYASGMLFKNVAIAKLFHWICGLLLFLALIVKIDEVTQNKKLSLFFGFMFWLTPTLINQIATTYIDAGISLFVFLEFCLLIKEPKKSNRSDFFYAGLFIGIAIAIRYLALAAFFAGAVVIGIRMLNRTDKMSAIKGMLYFATGTFISSAYWFARGWIYSGNPIFPYFGSWFGQEDPGFFFSMYYHAQGLPRSIGSFLSLPWNLTFRPHFFDYHHWLGPVYLLMLPVAIYAAAKIKSARYCLLFTFLFTIFWYFTGQIVRYLLPIFPIYLMASAIGVSELAKTINSKNLLKTAGKSAAYGLTVFMLCLTGYHFRYQYPALCGIWNEGEYLNKMERTIPIAEWINAKLPEDSKILVLDEVHLYYFNLTVVLEPDFEFRTHYQKLDSPQSIAATLKKYGFTHILEKKEITISKESGGAGLPKRPIDQVLNNPNICKPVVSIQSSNIVESKQLYVLYGLS